MVDFSIKDTSTESTLL